MSRPDVWATGLRLPSGWVCRSEPGARRWGTTLVAGPPETGLSGAMAPQLVVRLVQTAATEERWAADLLAELHELPDLDLEDEDVIDLGGQDVGYLRYSHRGLGLGSAGTTDRLSERWSWWHDGIGLTLTGTVARADYEAWYDLFESVAATVDVTRLGAPVTSGQAPS